MEEEKSGTESEEKSTSEDEKEKSTTTESSKESDEGSKKEETKPTSASQEHVTAPKGRMLKVKKVISKEARDKSDKDESDIVEKGSGEKPEKEAVDKSGGDKAESGSEVLGAAGTAQEEIKAVVSNFTSRILSLFCLYVLPWLYLVLMSLAAKSNRRGDLICEADYCMQAAKYIQSSINTSHKPCDNFYRYVCDGWRASYGDDVDAGVTLLNMSQYFLRSDNMTSNVLKAHDVLELCHSAFSSVLDPSFDDLKLFLKNTLGLNWPAKTLGGVQAISDIVVYLQMAYSINPFFDVRISSGMKFLSVSVKGRYHPWYLHYRLTQQAIFREKLISTVASTLSSNVHSELVSNIIAIEDTVEGIAAGIDTKRQFIKVKVLSHTEFKFAWPFISSLWRYCRPRQRQLLARRTTCAVQAEWTLRAVLTFLTNSSQVEAILDYIGWVVVESLGRRLSPTLRRAMAGVCDAYKVNHIARHVFRSDNCYWETYRLFALVLDRQNFRFFNRSLLADVNQMFQELISRGRDALYLLPWMDQTTRLRMEKHLLKFTCSVGLLRKYRYRNAEAVYDKLPEVDPDDSILNVSLRITKTLNAHYLSTSFRQAYHPEVWSAVPSVRFVAEHYTVFVPTSMVMLPLYERTSVPISLLYGRTAVHIALAIFRESYKSHVALSDSTWTLNTERRFQVYLDCVNRGFENKTTLLGERALAYIRVFALRIVFQMYQQNTLKIRRDTSLHLENATTALTAHQLFFIGSCLDLCTRDDEQLSMRTTLCNLPLRRVKGFVNAFLCDTNDKLGPLYFPCTPLRLAKQYYSQ